MDAVAIVVAAGIPILAVGVVAWVLLKRLRAREDARRIVRD